MRRMLYLGLTEALKELKDDGGQPLIRHIDLWNEQVEFIEQERSVPAACGHQMERKRKGRKHVSGGIAGTL